MLSLQTISPKLETSYRSGRHTAFPLSRPVLPRGSERRKAMQGMPTAADQVRYLTKKRVLILETVL